ncbi:hypothetical protein [Gaoshiqia sediminis]|uniref:Uroporphyrinogen decarboxylase (URO-D) domain-containing protein n=1 Tax=Gaoshiqia sediminis TaxID=2986998 RepID=A0AA41Y4L3_9BACT|nr:hypothetical protein [Gaoshiqia sediminis]MCW0481809.1 hypothetical protein [Gaoshiqia sediminis]
MKTWKTNWEESQRRYIDWWNGKGIVLSMWEHLQKDGAPHEVVPPPALARDLHQLWFDPKWRAENLHYQLSRSSFKADILPVANTHLGPGSLAAMMGAVLDGGEDTIWIKHVEGKELNLTFNENDPYWKLHEDLLKACKANSANRYYVGCPDLVEGLDVLASIRGTSEVMMDMIMDPDGLEQQLQQVNDVYFEVFDRIYNIIREGDEMAFCYFSIWGPGKVSKLQCDLSIMISEEDFRRFVQPYIWEQCRKIDYTLYHLDGVDAQRHLDALLEIDELNAIQWTPGVGQPQGGDPSWYNLYKRILAGGKSVMANWVTLDELEPLLDNVGNQGLHINVDFKSEKDIDTALKIVEKYR